MLLAALALACALPAHDRTAADVAREFYVAYANADAAAIASITALPARDRAALAHRLQSMASASCRTLDALRVIERDGHTIRVEVALTKTPRLAGAKPQHERHHATLELDDSLAITRWRIDEEALAARAATEDIAAAASSLDPVTLSRALSQEAIRHCNASHFAAARRVAAAALAFARETMDPGSSALALSVESVLARLAPPLELQKSVERAHEAVRLAESSGDPDILGKVLVRAGRAINRVEYRLTLEYFERVIAMADALEDASTPMLAATQLGAQTHATGDGRAAFRYGELTRLYAARTNDPIMQMQPDLHLAGLYLGLDEWLAYEHAINALRIARQAGYDVGIASALNILVRCYAKFGDTERYLAAIAEALERYACIGLTNTRIELLVERGRFHYMQGRFDEARRDLDTALELHARDPVGSTINGALLFVAEFELMRGRPEATLAELSRRDLHPNAADFEGWHFWLVANALAALGHCAEAYANFEIWLRISDRWRAHAPGGDRQRRLAFESPAQASWPLIDLLVSDGRHAEALQIAEWAKSRTLLDVLTRGASTIDENRLGPDEIRERGEMESRISRLKHDTAEGGDANALRRARAELESFRVMMAAKYPLPAIGHDVTLSQGGTLAFVPPAGTALVEYVATADALFVWAITPRGVRARRVAVRESAIRELIAPHDQRLSSRDFRHTESGRKLFDVLLAPVWEEVRGATTIGFIPDRLLWHVPMQTLTATDGRLLVEHAAVFYVPSLNMLRELRASSPRPPAAVVIADPYVALPDASAEAKAIAALYPRATLIANGNAGETRAAKAMPAASILHIATHGEFDDGDPMYSHLLLRASGSDTAAQDGFLEAWEIARMRLDADLAVLSACETARGQVRTGEGLVGMSWAFLAAGARTTVVSQWNVDSRATAELMTGFHRRYAAGASPSAALRAAQLRLMEKPQYRHPMYWAPFIVVGAP